MRIQYFGHATFLITTASGTRILTDPINFASHGQKLRYPPCLEPVDVVTISHEHGDHSGYRDIKGTPVVIRGEGKFAAGDARFLGLATWHDSSEGAENGGNTVFVISADGLRIAHMGDLGHILTADQAVEIGNVDVILIPVGGHYTIDAAQADKVAHQLAAEIVIPMHYKTPECDLPIAGVEEFLEDKANVRHINGSALEITRESLPSERQIVVLESTG